MSKVLENLSNSDDPIDRELSRILKLWQDIKRSKNQKRYLGREPQDIIKRGAREVIQSRVRNRSGGFEDLPTTDSYEGIVVNFPDRFDRDVFAIASERLGLEPDAFEPTTDPDELDRRTKQLIDKLRLAMPDGSSNPARIFVSVSNFFREPLVRAYVLNRAGGRCENCNAPAPFKKLSGEGYLEIHHVKRLADGGSDRVQNAIALCPNCHRAFHFASNSGELADGIYRRIADLIRE